METQGFRIKKIRQALDLSQADFGEKIGVSKQYVSNLEADRNILNNEKLVSLLVDLNVNINYLLAGSGSMFNTENDELEQALTHKIRKILKQEGIIK